MADSHQPQQVVDEQLCAGELASDEEEEDEEEGDIGYERLDVAAAVETLNEEECENMQEGYVLLSQEEEHVHESTTTTEERGDGDVLEEHSQPIPMAESK